MRVGRAPRDRQIVPPDRVSAAPATLPGAEPALTASASTFRSADAAARRPYASRTSDATFNDLLDARNRRSAARAVAGSSEGSAVQLAEQLRISPDSEKLRLLDSLEALGQAGHPGWDSVYNQAAVVEQLAGVVKETFDPVVERRATEFLIKVYRDHLRDDGSLSSYLKGVASLGLADTYGSDLMRVALRSGADDLLAEAMMNRAHWALRHPLVQAGKGTPLLEEMGISGAGQTVAVLDAAGSDHMAHTSYLANPARSGSRLLTYGMTQASGPDSVRQMKSALEEARSRGANVVTCSLGTSWEGRDKELYIQAAGGDQVKAKQQYDRDVAELQRIMDRFPGVIVVAAGNSGPNSMANDLAKSSKVIVAGAMDRTESETAPFNSPGHFPRNVLGVGTAVFAPGLDGEMRWLENATSWAAPQLAHFAACVYEGGSQFGQSVNAQEVRDILRKTAETFAGQIPRADVVTAVRYAKTLAYVKSTGDTALLRKLQSLPDARSREVANIVEPLLHNLGPNARARIAETIYT